MAGLRPLCRAELPSAVHTKAGTTPIRCGRRNECQRHFELVRPGAWPFGALPWACDGNRFDQFVPVASVTAG